MQYRSESKIYKKKYTFNLQSRVRTEVRIIEYRDFFFIMNRVHRLNSEEGRRIQIDFCLSFVGITLRINRRATMSQRRSRSRTIRE